MIGGLSDSFIPFFSLVLLLSPRRLLSTVAGALFSVLFEVRCGAVRCGIIILFEAPMDK
jgi:hypothetical protein